jgi:hypothetical protein
LYPSGPSSGSVGTTVWGDMNTVATGITQRLDLPEILEFLAGFPGLE